MNNTHCNVFHDITTIEHAKLAHLIPCPGEAGCAASAIIRKGQWWSQLYKIVYTAT